MAITVVCAGCGHKLQAADSLAGRRAKCPKCSAAILIPTSAAAFPEVKIAPPKPAQVKTDPARAPLPAVQPPPVPGPVVMPPIRPQVMASAVQPPPTPPVSVSAWSMPTRPIAAEPVVACSFCGESILAVAKKCRFCGETLDVALRAAEEAGRLAQAASARSPFVPAAAPVQQTVIVQQTTAGSYYRFPHLLHLVLTVATCGLWLPVWVLHWLCHEIFG
ncbi:MAG: hypothetical protein ACYC35_16105 [Pirellulales bacterium]